MNKFIEWTLYYNSVFQLWNCECSTFLLIFKILPLHPDLSKIPKTKLLCLWKERHFSLGCASFNHKVPQYISKLTQGTSYPSQSKLIPLGVWGCRFTIWELICSALQLNNTTKEQAQIKFWEIRTWYLMSLYLMSFCDWLAILEVIPYASLYALCCLAYIKCSMNTLIVWVLLKQTWIYLHTVKSIYWHQVVVKESTVCIAECQTRRMRGSCSKYPNSLITFREGVLKAVWGRELQGAWSACAQFSGWLASRWSFKHHQPSSFRQSRVYFCGQQSWSVGGLLPVRIS